MAVFGIRSAVRAQLADTPRFAAAFDFIDNCLDQASKVRASIDQLELGAKKRIDLTGGAFALVEVYMARSRETARWETHVSHIDVQTILEGTEFAEVSNRDLLQLAEDRTPKEDVIFYANSDVRGSALHFLPGDIGVYFPTDAHRAGLVVDQPALVRKVVVKVPVS